MIDLLQFCIFYIGPTAFFVMIAEAQQLISLALSSTKMPWWLLEMVRMILFVDAVLGIQAAEAAPVWLRH